MEFKRERLSEFIELIEGDCLGVLPTLAPGEFDAVVTDPPYGLGSKLAGGTWGAKYAGGLEWDQQIPDNLRQMIELAKHSIIWGGNYFPLPPARCQLIWWKPDAVHTMADAEIAWTNFDANTRVLRHSIAATNAERGLHPTQKPLRVMQWSVQQLPDNAHKILDPFAGSGTTGIAAAMEGRHCLLIEKDPRYCCVIRDRVARYEGMAPGSFLTLPVESDLFHEPQEA